jgi:hypothetical protein
MDTDSDRRASSSGGSGCRHSIRALVCWCAMTSTISDDSKATLLLCGHFFAQRQEGPRPLAQREFNDVARWLGRSSLGPGALFDSSVRSNFACETGISESRIGALIERGGALALAMERWGSRGIWVLTRLDGSYPKRLTERLGCSRFRRRRQSGGNRCGPSEQCRGPQPPRR